jgi:EpsI family protein
VLGLLAPDDYTSRTYVNAEGRPVYLFIAYYLSQRSGKTLHSPQNCLPGAGWEIIQRGNLNLADNATINDFTIAKENDRMITYYWYQGRGRVEANEYWDKIYGVQDAVFKNRTDAALVRVMVDSSDKPGVEEASRKLALDFIQQLRPELARFIPN